MIQSAMANAPIIANPVDPFEIIDQCISLSNSKNDQLNSGDIGSDEPALKSSPYALQMIMSLGNRLNPNLINNLIKEVVESTNPKAGNDRYSNNVIQNEIGSYKLNSTEISDRPGKIANFSNSTFKYSHGKDYSRKRYNSCSNFDFKVLDKMNNNNTFEMNQFMQRDQDNFCNTSERYPFNETESDFTPNSKNENNLNSFGNFISLSDKRTFRASQSLEKANGLILTRKFEPKVIEKTNNQRDSSYLDDIGATQFAMLDGKPFFAKKYSASELNLKTRSN